MVEVVIPLGVDPVTANSNRIDDARIVHVPLGNEPGLAPERARLALKSFGHLAKHMIRAEVINPVNRVEPKRVDVILSQPVQRIVDEETPYAVALRTVKIYRRAPRRPIDVGKAGGVFAKIVSFRTQVVVYDVEHDGHAFTMAGVDEPLESRRAAIPGVGRVEMDAIITPVAGPGKGCNRHNFESSDAQLAQVGKPADRAVECALGRKGSSM